MTKRDEETINGNLDVYDRHRSSPRLTCSVSNLTINWATSACVLGSITQLRACTIRGGERYLVTAQSILVLPCEEDAADARDLAYSKAAPLEYSLSLSTLPLWWSTVGDGDGDEK